MNEEIPGRFAKGGLIPSGTDITRTVKVRRIGERTEYWEPSISAWVPVLTAEQVSHYGARALADLNERTTQ